MAIIKTPVLRERDLNASCSRPTLASLCSLQSAFTMDIEIDDFEQSGYAGTMASTKLVDKRPSIVPVDEAHPFDLDAYISGYSGAPSASAPTLH